MGRAPTSGNCHTCRQRRVKCDKGRPSCQRCLKAGYECQGYEVVLRIQSHAAVAGSAPGTSRLAKIQTVSSFPSGPSGPARRSRSPISGDGDGNGLSGADCSRSTSASRRSAFSSNRAVFPPPELSLAPFVDDFSFSYFFNSYGWINMHSILLQDTAMQSHLKVEGMAYDSLRALSYGLLGRDHHIESLQNSAQRLYGATLHGLQAKLNMSSKDELAALVKPIAILGSYSVTYAILAS